MFTQLSIRNFKAWRDTKDIRLAPITVFFGSNSAGKTSLLQFLLMLRQTAESRDRRRVLNPGDESTDVDLGTYRDLVFNHDVNGHVDFSLSWQLPKPLVVTDVLNGKEYRGSQMSFQADISSDEEAKRQTVELLRYTLSEPPEDILSVQMKKKGQRKQKQEYAVGADPDILVRTQGRAWAPTEPVKFYGFPDEVLAYHRNAGFTSDLVLSFEHQLQRIKYLGPLRQRPRRLYTWSGEAPESVGFDGRYTLAALLAASGRQLNRGFHMRNQSFLEVVVRWLHDIGLLDGFEPKATSKLGKQYEIVVKATSSGVRTNLPDVGFGISQVLPVVVQSFYAEPGSTVVIEQPELHLHPRVQAFLVDLFIEAIRARQNGENRNVQFLIESHSEHFVYRLQRRIAEGTVKPEDVALYFCRPGPEGSIIEPLRLDEDGDILNWPENFFGDEMEDVRARLSAAADRRAKLDGGGPR
jgi:predicted ATPase